MRTACRSLASSARLKKSPLFGADHLAQVAAPAEGLDLLAVGVALVDPELADLECGPLVDGERDLDAVAIGREHHARRRDRHGEEAPVVIGRVDHEHVALEDVLPERAARAEGEEAALAGEHDVAQLVVGAMCWLPMNVMRRTVTGSCSMMLNLTMTSLSLLRDDLERRLGEEVALLGVDVADLLNAAAERGVAEDRVGLDLDALRCSLSFSISLLPSNSIS